MSSTLAALYTRYSARLAAHVTNGLATAGADPLMDTEDVTQETWLLAAQLSALPSRDTGWSILMGLANQVIAAHQLAEHRTWEVLSGPMATVPNPAPEAAPAPDAESAPVPALTTFRAQHGECTTWSTATIEMYEHLVEGAHPAIAHAVRTDLVVVGRHAEAGLVVVDLCTADELAANRARTGKSAATAICETALAS